MSDLTMAVSEEGLNESLQTLLDPDVTSFGDQDQVDAGPVTAGYDLEGHFELDKLDFRNDPDRVKIDELDIVWDTLECWLGLDIPRICIGGFCLIPGFTGCAVRAPKKCIFKKDPDIQITLDLSWLRSEVSTLLMPIINYRTHRGSRDYLAAQIENWRRYATRDSSESGHLDNPAINFWELTFHPDTIDIDLIDRADVIGDLLEDAFSNYLNSALSWLPGWAKDILRKKFGSFVDMVRKLLDLPDDLGEWLSDILQVSLDIPGVLIEVLDNFFDVYPAYRLEDPYPIMHGRPTFGHLVHQGHHTPSAVKSQNPTIPVKIPIDDVAVDIGDTELVVTGDFG